MPLTKAPAVGLSVRFRLNRTDSNFGLSAFSWDRSDPAACSNISTPRSVFLPIGAIPIRLIGYSVGR